MEEQQTPSLRPVRAGVGRPADGPSDSLLQGDFPAGPSIKTRQLLDSCHTPDGQREALK